MAPRIMMICGGGGEAKEDEADQPRGYVYVIERAGHHLMAEKVAHVFRARLSDWLLEHGF